VEYAAMAGILAGIVAMFQPWSLALYRLGFLLLFMATLFYILWSHISPMITEELG
jgi:phage shock protein PspC (stress-responsive transcriptional regulator)